MSIEHLFRLFDDLADSPERIPAIRRLIVTNILTAAVTAPDALSRAEGLREAHGHQRRVLTEATGHRFVTAIPDVQEKELPPSLAHLSTTLFDRLGNIASIEKGLSQIQKTRPGEYPLVVTAESRSSSKMWEFEGAAAIVPLVSSTGHGDASLKRLHYQEGRYAVGNILAVVKPICPEILRARFIYEYLAAFKEELLVSRMVGTANVSLTLNKLKEVPIPLVSGLALSRIHELMALCDQLEIQQQERETRHTTLARASLAQFADAPTPGNLQYLFRASYTITPVELRKSILALAIQGKLVPQDPKDEPAQQFIHRLQIERRHRFEAEVIQARREGTRPPRPPRNGFVPQVDEEAQDLPYAWCVTRVGDVSDCLDYLRVPVNKGDRLAANGRVPYYGANGQVGWIDKHLFDEELVLVVEDETFIGRIKPFSYVIRGKSWVNNHAHVLRPLGGMTADFLNIVLCRYPFIPLTSGTTNRRKLTQPSLMDARISLPPLAEQRRIVAKVEQLMALVDVLETKLAATRSSAENLLSALAIEPTAA